MTVNKRSKRSRMRGSHTHGWGEKKKHRGSGDRGGYGNAGSGKKADQKKPSFWKDPKWCGKHGFKKKGIFKEINPINLKTILVCMDKWMDEKLITLKNNVYDIDLEKLGYNKVLGCCPKLDKKLRISAEMFAADAIEKINAAGGEAIITGEVESEDVEEEKPATKEPVKKATPKQEEKTEIKKQPKKNQE
jgi:large subunit ribosomal protein L15